MLIYQCLLKLVLKRKFSNSLLFWDKYLLKRSIECAIHKYAVHGVSAPARWITKLKNLFDKSVPVADILAAITFQILL